MVCISPVCPDRRTVGAMSVFFYEGMLDDYPYSMAGMELG
jgi:hypothetical protein